MIQDMIAREREKFRQEGKVEGEALGVTKGKAEVARSLLAQGVEISVIAQCTGLSEADIMQLHDDNQPQ